MAPTTTAAIRAETRQANETVRGLETDKNMEHHQMINVWGVG